jgi:D-alanyl-D-alanine carboxypeptidase
VSARGRRLLVCGLITAIAAVTFTVDHAEAKKRKRHYRHAKVVSYSPAFSSIIVDANSGSTLQANNPDAQRFPASLTKIMTLYLLFERLESGKMRLDTEMPVSTYASRQAPTKLGLRAGSTLTVEDAIKGLITRSANDASVVIAEAVGGDVDDFAVMMTRKARALGMSRTTYKNPNGLPDSEQVTTARDQATLGRAIQDRFLRYYRYFATNTFHYRGKAIANHNKLLGRVEGVDGIKTGYTRASGFNLVTSIKRGNRHLVGVVLGGRSGGSRDAIMRNLLAEHIDRGESRRTVASITENNAAATQVAQNDSTPVPQQRPVFDKLAAKPEAKSVDMKPTQVASEELDSEGVLTARRTAAPVRVAAIEPPAPVAQNDQRRPAPLTNGVISSQSLAPIPGSTEPMTPVRVRTLQVKAGTTNTKVASAGPTPVLPQPAFTNAVEAPKANVVAGKAELAPTHGRGLGVLGTLPAGSTTMAYADPAPRPAAPQTATARHETAKPTIRSGSWIIQVGALESEADARARLDAARESARSVLTKAEPFTETVAKGERQLYRARFAGFVDRDRAEAACKTLKRSDISCIAIKY